MTRIFVLESLSGGAQAADEPDLLAAGLAMRDAIVADLLALGGLHLSVAAGPGMPPPPGVADRVAPRVGESVEDFVRRLAPSHDASWIVAPETDGGLARLREAVGAAGWIGCEAAAIDLATSKSATLAHLRAHGVATPADVAAAGAGRWIVKPDDGAGTLATRVHADRARADADLAARRATGAHATLQPFVEGQALSISLVVGANLAKPVRIVAFNAQRIVADADGWLRDDGVQAAAIGQDDVRAQALRTLACQVADAMPGLCGFVGIDLIWNEEHGPVLIEVNPRVTTAYVGLSRKLGRNLAADVLLCAGLAQACHAPLA
jgi:predicted ATP-grasp superfamily ATP-dependent carboligase